MNSIISKSPEDTEKIGRKIARKLVPGSIVTFTGGLGSGKTFIIKSICRELGIKEVVTSPTFTLMHIYKSKHSVAHFDCYRLQNAEEAEMLGIYEYFDSDYICLIEWADRIKPIIPGNAVNIAIGRIKGKQAWRSFSIQGL